jgi:hypothetical protein
LIVVYSIIGLFGFYLLVQHLKIGKISGIIISVIYMLSAVYVLQIREGHIGYFAMAWLPWIFLLYLKSYKSPKFAILAGVLLAFAFFDDHGYLFAYYVLFLSVFSLFEFLRKRNLKIFFSLLLVLAFALLISSIKLIPVASFLKEKPYTADDSSGYNFNIFVTALMGRDKDYGFPDQWAWHEYGAYIGIVPVLLVLFGIIFSFKKNWPLVFTAIFFIILAFNQNFQINLWQAIHSLPYFDSFRTPSRFIIIVIFSFALLAGESLSWVERKNKVVCFALLLLIVADLISINSRQIQNAFPVAPIIGNTTSFYQVTTDGAAYRFTTKYDIFLKNEGTVNCGEPVHLEPHAIPKEILGVANKNYRGEVYLLNNSGEVYISYFSPNIIDVDFQTNNSDMLILNQNFYNGWNAKDIQNKDVESFQGLISTNVSPAEHHVTFYYLPKSFIEGLLMTALGVILSVYAFSKNFFEKIGSKIDREINFPRIEVSKKTGARLRIGVVILFIIFSFYQFPKYFTQFANWKYSENFSQNWYSYNFQDSGWTELNSKEIFFERFDNISQEYFRGILRTYDSKSVAVKITGDDCIENFYVNGDEIFSQSNCGMCNDCSWRTFDLSSYLKNGDNLLAIKILNSGGGPTKFEIKLVDKYDMSLVIVILTALIAYMYRDKINRYAQRVSSFLKI